MRKISWILVCCFLLGLSSCGGEEKKEDPRMLLIGSWRSSHMSVHTVLTLKNNGSWQSEDRMEGMHTRIVEKRGKSTGRWEMESKKSLIFSVETAEDAGNWEAGAMAAFGITTLTASSLVLQGENGRSVEWTKIRVDRPGQGEIVPYQVVSMPPLVLNMARSRILERQRFLCLDMEFVLNLDDAFHSPEAIIPPAPPLHPEVREMLIFYLSTFEYKDINSFEKVKMHRLHLRKMLNPYFDNQLFEVEIRNIIVASSMESLEEFAVQHPQLRYDLGFMPVIVPVPAEVSPEPPEGSAAEASL